MKLITFVLLAVPLVDEAALTRDVSLSIIDRLGRAVPDVAACRIAGETCAPLKTRRDGDDVVLALPKGEPVKVRVSAPGFETFPAQWDPKLGIHVT